MILIVRPLFLFLSLILVALDSPAQAQQVSPKFENYSVPVQPVDRPMAVRLGDKKSKRYASVLRDAAQRPPDFAGHFILASWGCGASCVMAAAIDARSGSVTWLPFTVCCWALSIMEPLDYRRDSQLLVVHGMLNEKGGGTHYYRLTGSKFMLLGDPPQI